MTKTLLTEYIPVTLPEYDVWNFFWKMWAFRCHRQGKKDLLYKQQMQENKLGVITQSEKSEGIKLRVVNWKSGVLRTSDILHKVVILLWSFPAYILALLPDFELKWLLMWYSRKVTNNKLTL